MKERSELIPARWRPASAQPTGALPPAGEWPHSDTARAFSRSVTTNRLPVPSQHTVPLNPVIQHNTDLSPLTMYNHQYL